MLGGTDKSQYSNWTPRESQNRCWEWNSSHFLALCSGFSHKTMLYSHSFFSFNKFKELNNNMKNIGKSRWSCFNSNQEQTFTVRHAQHTHKLGNESQLVSFIHLFLCVMLKLTHFPYSINSIIFRVNCMIIFTIVPEQFPLYSSWFMYV